MAATSHSRDRDAVVFGVPGHCVSGFLAASVAGDYSDVALCGSVHSVDALACGDLAFYLLYVFVCHGYCLLVIW